MDKIKCVQCGKMIASDSRFCPECGAEQTKFCPGCGGKIVLGQLKCPTCGKNTSNLFVSEDVRVINKPICPSCGGDMIPHQETVKSGTSGCGVVALGILLILVGLFLAIFLGRFIALAITIIGFIIVFSDSKKTETVSVLVCSNCGYRKHSENYPTKTLYVPSSGVSDKK